LQRESDARSPPESVGANVAISGIGFVREMVKMRGLGGKMELPVYFSRCRSKREK